MKDRKQYYVRWNNDSYAGALDGHYTSKKKAKKAAAAARRDDKKYPAFQSPCRFTVEVLES